MSRTVTYTDRFKPAKFSEVVSEVFYNKNQEELYVVLHTGNIAGYHSVPEYKYLEFKDFSSAGKFWNWYIKGKYGTLNGDVDFAPNTQVKESGKESFSVIVEVDGSLKFDIDATDVQAALTKVSELVEKTLYNGTFYIREVKFNQS